MRRLFGAVYVAGIVAQVIVRFPHQRRRERIAVEDSRVTLSERAILSGLSVAGLLLPLVYGFTRWLEFADYRLSPGASVRLGKTGTAVLAAAVWLFWRSHRDLGTNWWPTVAVGTGQTLTTNGVYGAVRHPMYASQFLFSLAQALLLQNWIAGPASLLPFAAMYLVRVPEEEQMMLEHFGDDYREYATRTGRILPRLPR